LKHLSEAERYGIEHQTQRNQQRVMAPSGYCLDHDNSPEFGCISDLRKKLLSGKLYRAGTLHFQGQSAVAPGLKTA
jgi:hypothetical protein